MSKHAIFHIEGGIGKHVASTAVVKAYKKQNPDRKIIVVCAWPEVFLNNKDIHQFLDWVTYLISIKIIYTVKM